MPSLESELAAEAAELRAKEEHAVGEQEAQRRNAARLAYANLSALAGRAEFRWFLEEFIKPVVEEERKKALDPATAAKQGAVHAHRHQVAETIHGMFAAKLAYYEEQLQQAAQR